MFIRPPMFFPLPTGAAGTDCEVYIGRSNTDPTIEANKLTLTDGLGGATISNPFTINAMGMPRNNAGQSVHPYIVEDEYCMEYRSTSGAIIDRFPRMRSDSAASGATITSDIADAVVDNFAAALLADLTTYNIIFIRSYASGWAGTGVGPVGGFFAYRTGSAGTASTGNPGAFYDAQGNQFKPANFQRLYAEMFGAKVGLGNDSFAAIRDMIAAAIALEKPCYFDGDEYYINTQSNVAAGYTLMSFYAIKINGNLAMYGNGNTVIKNTTNNNAQYLFFAENVDNLVIDGLILDGNSSNLTTGALYCAGVTRAVLNCTIKNSGPLYLSGSTTRQTDSVTGDLTFQSSSDYAISGNSAGFKKLDLDSILFVSCAKGISITNADINSFGYGLTAPDVNIGHILGTVTGELFNLVTGSLNFDVIHGTIGTLFKCSLGTDNFTMVKGSSISVTASKILELNSTTGGKLQRFDVDNVYARSLTTGIQIDSASQLINNFRIGHIDIDGSVSAITIGDDTGNGKIKIDNGKISGLVGITINQTTGQQLTVRNVDFSGCTTAVVNRSKSVWTGEPPAQAYAYNATTTFTHNLGQIPTELSVFFKCTANDGPFVIGDIVEIGPYAEVYLGNVGITYKVSATNVVVYTGEPVRVMHAASAIVALTNAKWDIYVKCGYRWNF